METNQPRPQHPQVPGARGDHRLGRRVDVDHPLHRFHLDAPPESPGRPELLQHPGRVKGRPWYINRAGLGVCKDVGDPQVLVRGPPAHAKLHPALRRPVGIHHAVEAQCVDPHPMAHDLLVRRQAAVEPHEVLEIGEEPPDLRSSSPGEAQVHLASPSACGVPAEGEHKVGRSIKRHDAAGQNCKESHRWE